MLRLVFILLGALVFVLGCSKEDAGLSVASNSVVVGSEDVPDVGEGVYFNVSVRPGDDPRPLLEELVDGGVDLVAAWQPRYETPCAAPTATAALVVQVQGPAPGIEDLGFVSDPEPWIPNCGIREFWEYRPVN